MRAARLTQPITPGSGLQMVKYPQCHFTSLKFIQINPNTCFDSRKAHRLSQTSTRFSLIRHDDPRHDQIDKSLPFIPGEKLGGCLVGLETDIGCQWLVGIRFYFYTWQETRACIHRTNRMET